MQYFQYFRTWTKTRFFKIFKTFCITLRGQGEIIFRIKLLLFVGRKCIVAFNPFVNYSLVSAVVFRFRISYHLVVNIQPWHLLIIELFDSLHSNTSNSSSNNNNNDCKFSVHVYQHSRRACIRSVYFSVDTLFQDLYRILLIEGCSWQESHLVKAFSGKGYSHHSGSISVAIMIWLTGTKY